MYKNKPVNTVIRFLYSPGYSSLRLSLYAYNLVFSFSPHIGKDNRGFDKYCTKRFSSTSVNYESASFFYQTAMSIITGENSNKEILAVLQCSNNTTLTFEYKPNQNNQMCAHLAIAKNNEVYHFLFPTHQYQVKENGQTVTKVIQSGLGVFAKTLDGYLTGIGADNHLSKLPENFNEYQDYNEQVSAILWNNAQH